MVRPIIGRLLGLINHHLEIDLRPVTSEIAGLNPVRSAISNYISITCPFPGPLREHDISADEHLQFLSFLATTRQPALNRTIYLLGFRAVLQISSVVGLTLNDVLDESGNLKEVVEL